MKRILLTFDVEEFDWLNSFENVGGEEIYEISRIGLERLLELLEKYEIKVTLFTTTNFAKKYPELVKKMSENHEIACHGYCHKEGCFNLINAKKEKEKIIGKKIFGFRAPRFEINNIQKLNKFGFIYDSSVHPSFVSSRGKNLFSKKGVYKIGKIKEITLSVLPFFRLPISWIFFRNFGSGYAKIFTKINFISSNYTMLLFHPWEFADLKKYNLPWYVKNNSGNKLLKMLEDYILFCKKKGWGFERVGEFLMG